MTIWRLAWGLFALLASQSWADTQMEQIAGDTMGTTYSIQWRQQQSLPATRLRALVEQELERVNASLSVFRPDSEISRLNLLGPNIAMQVSTLMAEVLEISQRVSAQTNGALDVTLGPVIEFWGFGSQARDLSHKDLGQLELARSKTGMAGFSLESGRVTKSISGLEINPSAVAKGYGVDRVAGVLDDLGIANYLVEIGGEIRTRGERDRGKAWRVAVTRPEKFNLGIQEVLELGNMSMATSGNYVNYIESGGKRFSHIIDPLTGMPTADSVLSVTVVHEQCATADAFATAMMVLDVSTSLEIANRLGLAVMLVEKTDSGLTSHYSKIFTTFLPSVSGMTL